MAGCGRLVLAAALLWPERFVRCAGCERVPELHKYALSGDARAANAGLLPPNVPSRQYVCEDASEALAASGE